MEKHRILVIDDEPALTQMIKLNLERTGKYVVQEANQTRDVLPIARQFQPDLVLLDVVMPDAETGPVASQLCADPQLRRVPIVLLTTPLADTRDDADEPEGGSLLLLPKPVTAKSLLRCVANNLG